MIRILKVGVVTLPVLLVAGPLWSAAATGLWGHSALGAAFAFSPADQAEERAEDKAEGRAEDAAEERAEQAAEDRAEQAAEERAEDQAEDRAESQAEDRAESQAEELAESRAEEQAESRAEDRADDMAADRARDAAEDLAEREAAEKALEVLEAMEALEDPQDIADERDERHARRPPSPRGQADDSGRGGRGNAGDPAAPRGMADFRIMRDGAGEPAIDGEIVALVRPDAVADVVGAGYTIAEETTLESSGLVLLRVPLSDTTDTDAAMDRFRDRVTAEAVDVNHVYSIDGSGPQGSDGRATARHGPDRRAEQHAEQHAEQKGSSQGGRLRIGLMESGIRTDHPCLDQANIVQRDFRSYSGKVPLAHGTAVASLIAGCHRTAPDAGIDLFNASVFFVRSNGVTAGTATSLVRALDWLVARGVRLINMSLSGPPNALLHRAVKMAHSRNIVIVAAVGNDGPAAPPRYPAAYEDVIGITAVDGDMQIYRRAGRGQHVAFAAPGVDIPVASDQGGMTTMSGTSIATPLAGRSVSAVLSARPDLSGEQVQSALACRALDLGADGWDPVYGHGFVDADRLSGGATLIACSDRTAPVKGSSRSPE